MKKFYFLACVLMACSSEEKGVLLAEAYGKKLYSTETDRLMNENTSFEDSVFIAKEYKNTWISRQVMLAQASTVLSEEERNKTKEMEQYRNDLLVYETINKLAQNRIDTAVTEVEIEEYYEGNLKEFDLSQNIIKVDFYRIPEESEFLEPFWKKFKRNELGIGTLIQKQAERANWSYYQSNGEWVFFDDILKEIPINTYNQEHYLNNHKYIRLEDGDFVYFVKIIDFKVHSQTAPIALEKKNIKNTILQQRQQEMVKKLETQLVSDAYNNNKIVIH